MWRIFDVLAACVASGAGALILTIVVLFALGLKVHGNYEYYGGSPEFYLGPALIGFLVPAVLAWFRPRAGVRTWLGTIARILGALVLVAVAALSVFFALAAREAPPESWWAYWAIEGVVGLLSLLGAVRLLWPVAAGGAGRRRPS